MRFTNPLLTFKSQLKKSPSKTKSSLLSQKVLKPNVAIPKKTSTTPPKPKATGWGIRSAIPMEVNQPKLNESKHIIFSAPPYQDYQDCNLKEIPEIPVGHTLFYRANSTSSRLVEVILRHNGFIYSEDTVNYTLRWLGPNLVPEAYTGMTHFQKLNHFPGTSELTRKDKLAANIDAMRKISKKEFNFLPRTFVLPDQFDIAKRVIEKHDYSWIRKPWGKSSGRGIEVMDKTKILKKEKGYIISRYIDNPLLVNGFKFDLRLYVCVTSFDPLTVYIYKEGFARFATEPYRSPKDTVNRYVHLTNTAVNKLSDKYKVADDIHSESGSKWSISSLMKHLESKGVDSQKLMKSVQDVIVKTFLVVQNKIVEKIERNVTYKKDNCFELFGFDILIDDTLKPWLIEVNLSPSLGCSSPMDYEVKSNMICDLLNLVSIKVPTENELNGQVVLPPPRDFQKEYERRGGWSRIYHDNKKH